MKHSEVFEQYRLQERRGQQIGMTDAHEETFRHIQCFFPGWGSLLLKILERPQ